MTAEKKQSPLLDYFDAIEEQFKDRDPQLAEIVKIFGADGHFVLVLFLILPFLQPIPLPGLSTPFGVLIALAVIWYLRGKPPYVPQSWQEKTISKSTVLKIAAGSETIFRKIAVIIRPRLFLFTRGVWHTVALIFLIVNALLLSLPLPIPFSNTVPAWTIFFCALGSLEDDGVLILISFFMNLTCWLYFLLIYWGIEKGIGFF